MPNAPALLILADDLTGAADCAARWRVTGQPATVQFVPDAVVRPGATASISDSRHLSPPQATQRIQHLLGKLDTLHGQRWYKKIDSTLRGNLGAELDAMLAALGQTHAVICPAFPAQRRGLYNGILVCDPAISAPVDLPNRLAEQSQRHITLLSLDQVRRSPDALANDLRECSAQASLIVCDAMSDADLAAIVAATLLALPNALLCGSAGLFGALAARYPSAALPPEAPVHARRALIVVGSGSTMAHRQISELHERYQMQSDAAITLLHLPAPPANTILDGQHARVLAKQLADAAMRAIHTLQPDLLLIVGGDTAMALFERLAISELRIQHELLPGISLSHAITHSGEQYQVILKAGSFGDPATLADLLDRCADLQSARRNP
ncbi:MAG: four-carbon acid sugar kinase family protein [Roseiflexaceae bacterium]|nr:four-carbon acid sugar kinase family protein [Roseiflexaceae bacterium]